jgi:hypothetical protein
VRGQGQHGIGTQEDFSRWKPKGKEDWMTMTELARHVDRDVSWLRRLDRMGQLPKAARVKVGRLSVRLYSPRQAAQILQMFRARDAAKLTRSKPKSKGKGRAAASRA